MLVGVAALAWAALLGLLLAEAPRTAWPVVLAGSAGLLLGGVAVAGWKYPSWEAVLLLVGVPAIAVAVTAGRCRSRRPDRRSCWSCRAPPSFPAWSCRGVRRRGCRPVSR